MKCPAWLPNAVFYQVYPQSFRDANGDGIGDLPGLIEKLDYIRWLGCTAIWLSPCYVSPFLDAGYDVADYYRVAPRYGTNADLLRLFAEARRRGLRVFLDLVPGHTSIEHPWFTASCRHRRNQYSDYYIWTSDIWDDARGLRAVNGYAERRGNYVTNFFWCQPALNYGFAKPDPTAPWQQPTTAPGPRAVRAEIKKIMRHWLDHGAAGFRVDMADSLVKNDHDKRATNKLWRDIRAMLERDYPDAALVSEWSYPIHAIRAGFHMDFAAQFNVPIFNPLFRAPGDAWGRRGYFNARGDGDACAPLSEYLRHYRATKSQGYICFQSANHDMARMSGGRTPREIETAMAFILTMPGVPFIYYGDEIGLRMPRDLASKEGGYQRTITRTPMQWDTSRNAGFSTAPADQLYLPVDRAASRPCVTTQMKNPRSLLHAVRALIALRAATPALQADGAFTPLFLEKNTYPLVYLRRTARQRIIVALNPAGRPATASFRVPGGAGAVTLLRGRGAKMTSRAMRCTVTLSGISYGVFEIAPPTR
jgi:maltose alpha-D-glucosyltransferase/alpha-amylase